VTSFVALLQQGNSWLFAPSALLLGALHGLEPGHSKTMMAAFIVAIRGTVTQAALLGLSATVSHTAIVWIIALGGLYFGRQRNTEATEPYLQVVSAVMIIAVAAWMLWRTWRAGMDRDRFTPLHDHEHDHHHGRGHPHVFAHGRHHHGHDAHGHVHPHAAQAHPAPAGAEVFELVAPGYQDPHELAHANDIRRRFASRDVTTGQIVVFGLTGGLIPCPASITVLLLCLQLKRVALGAALVLCFSIGLALTMVATGALAALGVRHAARRFSGFGELARKAPYFSGAVILLIGLYIGYQGLRALA
jgi:nickel/cobalt transporter (NicO) family protein